MKVKEYYNMVLGLTDDEVEWLYEAAGKMGITVPELIEKVISLFSDETIGEELMKKVHVSSEPTFLSYLMSLSGGDLREFVDCLIFLKQKQKKMDEVDVLLKRIEGHAVDANTMAELKRICESYGVDVDKGNDDAVKACLEEEKEYIRIEMYAADLGFEPDNLYSAPDVLKWRFDEYCQLYMKEDADLSEELRKVLAWIEENEERFYPVD